MPKSIWDQLYDDPVEALDKKQRSSLLIAIISEARSRNSTVPELAIDWNVSNREAKELVKGYIDKFDVEQLRKICANVGINADYILQDIT